MISQSSGDDSGDGPAGESGAVFEPDELAEAAPAPQDRSPGRLGRQVAGRTDSLGPADRVVPTWTDPTVRRASEVIGGPLGVHAQVGRNAILTPLRVCLLMALVILVGGWLYKAACIQQVQAADGTISLDQSGERPWITGCYNDIVPLYGARHLDQLQVPYGTAFEENGTIRYMEYPVVTGFWMWGMAWLSQGYARIAEAVGLPVPLNVAGYFTITAIVLGMLYLFAVWCTARMARRRPWDVALMCLAPLLIVHAFTNWDLLAMALTAGAMLAWSRTSLRHDGSARLGMAVLAGLLLGVGTAAKLYPVLLLGPLLVLCLRTGRMATWTTTAVATVAGWLAVNLPVMLAWPRGWGEFLTMNVNRAAEQDSWYFLIQGFTGLRIFDAADGGTPVLLNTVSLVLFLLACAGIGWLALSAQRRPRVGQLAFLLIAAFLLTNKVWSPQFSLWLLPLVVLALPRWRPVLAWQFSEWVVWILLMLSFSQDTGKGLSIHPFLVAAVIRGILLIALMVKVVREILRPENDLIRQAGDDDPAGGVLENAPDRWTLPSLPSLWRRPRVAAAPENADVSSDLVLVPAGPEVAEPAEADRPESDPSETAGNGPTTRD